MRSKANNRELFVDTVRDYRDRIEEVDFTVPPMAKEGDRMERLSVYAVVMSFALLLVLYSVTFALSDVLLEEDFEAYKLEEPPKGDWEVIGTPPIKPTFFIADFPVHGGAKSLRVGYPTGTNETMGIKFDPTMSVVSVTCYTYPTSDQQTTFQAIVGGSTTVEDPDVPPDPAQEEDAYIGAFITFTSDSKVKYHGVDDWVDTGANYINRQWNKVVLEVNLETQTYSISLNDVRITQGTPFWHDLEELNVFAIRRSPQN
ncbi:hypothetical protein ACFL6S_36325, partial [Candidatus Poribacteria bacterium]